MIKHYLTSILCITACAFALVGFGFTAIGFASVGAYYASYGLFLGCLSTFVWKEVIL